MPIDNELLGLQRRDVHLGEIRIGTSVAAPTAKNPNARKPQRLNTFRLTTPLEHVAAAAAEKYGGKVAPWEGRRGYFEVITTLTRLRVFIPPRSLAVDANMELWNAGRRERQCDGRTMRFPQTQPGQPPRACMCPADPDERARLAGLQPPQACEPLTRFNVTLPELPGLNGIWSASTGSVNAAVETGDVGDILALARGQGAYLPGDLFIHWRKRADNAQPYPVLSLMIATSAEELARGELPTGPAGLVAQLQSAGERLAISGGGPAALPPAAGSVLPAVPVPPAPPAAAAGECDDDEVIDAEIVEDPGPEPAPAPSSRQGRRAQVAQGMLGDGEPAGEPETAQEIADEAALATTTGHRVRVLIKLAQDQGVKNDIVDADGEEPDELLRYLVRRLRALNQAEAA